MKKKLYLSGFLAVVLATACGGPSTAEEYWQRAESRLASREYAAALQDLSRLVDKYPDSPIVPQTHFKIADIYLNGTRELDLALAAFQVTADLFPDLEYGVKSLFMVGFVQANYLQEHDLAREAYQTFLGRYPNHELVSSVTFELENLGKEVEDIEALKDIIDGQ